jgi:pyroglutamyl-peptidase
MIDVAPSGRRPGTLLICGFGPFPESPENPSGPVAQALPALLAGMPARALTAPTAWSSAYETVAEAAEGCAAVLLLGVDPAGDHFEVEMRARNEVSLSRVDAAGARRAWRRISRSGPAVARSTAPVAAMVRAIGREGLPARASSDAGDYLCNYTLYRLLTERPALVTGFLHLPTGADFDHEALTRGAQAAALAFAGVLRTPAPAFAEA